MERIATAMKAMPASTSFPVISQTIKATIVAGRTKKRILTITIIMMRPITRRISNANKPRRPKEPKKSNAGNMACDKRCSQH
jgi:hypothetical protein